MSQRPVPTSPFAEWLTRKLQADTRDLAATAAQAGISAAYLSMLRNGQRRPSKRVVIALVNALNASDELEVALTSARTGRAQARVALSVRADARRQVKLAAAATALPDTEWLADTLRDYSTDWNCGITLVRVDGNDVVSVEPTRKASPRDAWMAQFHDCLAGSHDELHAQIKEGTRETVMSMQCGAGFTHWIAPITVAGVVRGKLQTGAFRPAAFQMDAWLEQARKTGLTLADSGFAEWVEETIPEVDALGFQALTIGTSHLARSIERAAALAVSRAAKEREAVAAIASSLTSRLSVEDVLCHILDGVSRLISFDYGNITEVDWERRQIRVLVSKTRVDPSKPGSVDLAGDEPAPSFWSVDKGITGAVAKSKRSLRLDDVRKDPRFIETWKTTKSELAVPLVLDGPVIGVLNLESDELAHFNEHDEQLLAMVAANVATGVDRARLRKQAREWREKFAAMAQLRRSLLDCPDEPALFETLARWIVAPPHDSIMCVIRLNDHEGRQLLLMAVAHQLRNIEKKDIDAKLPYASIAGRAVQTNRPVLSEDVQADERFGLPGLAKTLGLRGMMAVPIPSLDVRQPAVGCIDVYTTKAGESFNDDDVRLLEDIAGFVAVALSNLRASLELRRRGDNA